METPKTNSVPPLEAFLVIFVTFCLSVIIGAAVLLTIGEAPALVIGELLILVVPLVYLMLKRISIKTYIRIDLKPKYILLGIGFGGLLLLLNVVVSGLLTTVFGTSEAIEQSNALLSNLSGSTFGIIAGRPNHNYSRSRSAKLSEKGIGLLNSLTSPKTVVSKPETTTFNRSSKPPKPIPSKMYLGLRSILI